jgi:type IV pilus assembly protein PilF
VRTPFQCTHRLLAAALMSVLVACASQSSQDKSQTSDTAAAYNVQLGVAYLQQGNLNVAKDKLERAYKQNPRDPNVHTGLALLYERLGDRDRADNHYRTAVRLSPRNPEISNNYAVYLCKTNRVEEGVRRFLDAARNPLYSTPEAAYTNAGVCLRAVQRDDEAEKHFLSALEVRPNHAEAAFQLGDLDYQRGRFQEARTRLERWLGAFSPTPDLLFLGVRLSRATGDRLAAERYARRLRLDFPQSEQTRALAELNRNPG